MNKKYVDFLKEPMSDGRLKSISALLVVVASIFINAYFQITSYSALVRWFLNVSGEENVEQCLTDILRQDDTSVGLRIAFGLLMTVFVMLLLFLAAYWEEQDKNICHLFERASSAMFVPVLFIFAAALLMNVSLTAGLIFGVAAAIECMAVVVNSGKKAKCNSYIMIAVATAFFMMTVVLLTRNHFITMFA